MARLCKASDPRKKLTEAESWKVCELGQRAAEGTEDKTVQLDQGWRVIHSPSMGCALLPCREAYQERGLLTQPGALPAAKCG